MIKASVLAQVVKDVAAGYPDHQPETVGCRYFDEFGTPSCIVGHALARLGVEPDPFLDDGELNYETPVDELCDFVENDSHWSMEWLKCVQWWQDRGYLWSQAVEKSKRWDK